MPTDGAVMIRWTEKAYNIQDVGVFHLCGMDGSFAMESVKNKH